MKELFINNLINLNLFDDVEEIEDVYLEYHRKGLPFKEELINFYTWIFENDDLEDLVSEFRDELSNIINVKKQCRIELATSTPILDEFVLGYIETKNNFSYLLYTDSDQLDTYGIYGKKNKKDDQNDVIDQFIGDCENVFTIGGEFEISKLISEGHKIIFE